MNPDVTNRRTTRRGVRAYTRVCTRTSARHAAARGGGAGARHDADGPGRATLGRRWARTATRPAIPPTRNVQNGRVATSGGPCAPGPRGAVGEGPRQRLGTPGAPVLSRLAPDASFVPRSRCSRRSEARRAGAEACPPCDSAPSPVAFGAWSPASAGTVEGVYRRPSQGHGPVPSRPVAAARGSVCSSASPETDAAPRHPHNRNPLPGHFCCRGCKAAAFSPVTQTPVPSGPTQSPEPTTRTLCFCRAVEYYAAVTKSDVPREVPGRKAFLHLTDALRSRLWAPLPRHVTH